MGFIKNLFGKKEEPINTYADFWNWFTANEQTFYNIVKSKQNPEKDFFNKLSPKLDELKDGINFLTGMYDDNRAELIFTPDGIIKNIVFAEELVAAAPTLPNWKFTALKPATDIERLGIEMGGFRFDHETLSFYAQEDADHPDEVELAFVHKDYTEANKSAITNGAFIFLDNYLGELNSVTTIDNVEFVAPTQAEKDLVPMAKLKDYLIWREKEFVEKYSGIRYNTENDEYASYEGTTQNGGPLIAIMNSTLLRWDSKASHPWIVGIDVKYDGSKNNGLPSGDDFELMNAFEDELMLQLKDADGYLNVGRQTGDNIRTTYFACNDFRKPSKVVHETAKKYAGRLEIDYSIYRDKYWRTFRSFMPK